jgi:hypothetical protein
VQTYVLGSDITLNAPINLPTGATMTLVLSQDATGGRKLTANYQYKFPGGSKTLSSVPYSIDMVNIFNLGTIYMSAISLRYA